MLVPEGYGFKSIKWLTRIVLTDDYRANDSYASNQNNDPASPMKTLARLDVHAPDHYPRGQPITLHGVAIVGASGLRRVEYWLRPDQGTHGKLDPDDPAWSSAAWREAEVPPEPAADWASGLPDSRYPDGVAFVDADAQRLRQWPLPWSWVPWTARLDPLEPGAYEFRVRAVDLNGFAQPEPRPNPQSGIAEIPCQTFVVA